MKKRTSFYLYIIEWESVITSQLIKHKVLAVELKHLVHIEDKLWLWHSHKKSAVGYMIWPSLRSGDNHTGASRQQKLADSW